MTVAIWKQVKIIDVSCASTDDNYRRQNAAFYEQELAMLLGSIDKSQIQKLFLSSYHGENHDPVVGP